MAVSENGKKQALALMKYRRNRLQSDTTVDEPYMFRLNAVEEELGRKGIHLTDSAADISMLVDEAVFAEQNRDKQTGTPEWLNEIRRDRWMHDPG